MVHPPTRTPPSPRCWPCGYSPQPIPTHCSKWAHGLCAKLCPVDDIEGLPPRWKHDGSCTNCLACYHHCPQHAIHWGKMKRGQYVFNPSPLSFH
ncbi:MAG: 4Fe-4S binding protein, partial [Bacteroidaceae bacterium]|nr:4Fe-4S binding protein [Bacteroidaceae bacterium]